MSTILDDAFTDTSGTALSSHVPTGIGTSWTSCSALTGVMEISDANRLRGGASSAARAGYYSDVVPSSADQVATCTMVQRSTASRRVGAALRLATTGEAGYCWGYSAVAAQWELYSIGAAGALTVLGSYSQALTLDQAYTVAEEANGTTHTLDIDSVERINISDSTTTAANRVGVFSGNTNAGGNTMGSHIDNLVISDATAPTLPPQVYFIEG